MSETEANEHCYGKF